MTFDLDIRTRAIFVFWIRKLHSPQKLLIVFWCNFAW